MVPNQGRSSRASRRAGMRSSTSRASASRARTSSGARSAGASSVRVPSRSRSRSPRQPWTSPITSRMRGTPWRRRPPLQLVPHPARRPRIGEGGGARPAPRSPPPAAARPRRRRRPRPRRRRSGAPAPPAWTSNTARTATGWIAGPDSPPPRGPDPSRKRRVSGSMAMPITVLTSVTASAPASWAALGDLGEVRHVGAELGPSRPPAPAGRLAARPSWPRPSGRTGRGPPRCWGTTGSPRRRRRRRAPRPAGRPPAGTRRPCGPRSTPRPGRRWRAAPAGRRPARPRRRGPGGPTELIIPAVVSCTRSGGLPGHGLGVQRLHHHGAQRRQVEVRRQLGAVARRARRRHHRVGQRDRADGDRHVHGRIDCPTGGPARRRRAAAAREQPHRRVTRRPRWGRRRTRPAAGGTPAACAPEVVLRAGRPCSRRRPWPRPPS